MVSKIAAILKQKINKESKSQLIICNNNMFWLRNKKKKVFFSEGQKKKNDRPQVQWNPF